MTGLVVLVVLTLILLPTILDSPVKRRRRQGITVWDEMLARGEITYQQWAAVNRGAARVRCERTPTGRLRAVPPRGRCEGGRR